MNDDYRVDKPGDPDHGKDGRLVKYESFHNKDNEGTLRFPDGSERTFKWYELRCTVRIRV